MFALLLIAIFSLVITVATVALFIFLFFFKKHQEKLMLRAVNDFEEQLLLQAQAKDPAFCVNYWDE